MLQLERFAVKKNSYSVQKKIVQMQATQNACSAWCHRRSRATTWGIQRKRETVQADSTRFFDRGDSVKARRRHTYTQLGRPRQIGK